MASVIGRPRKTREGALARAHQGVSEDQPRKSRAERLHICAPARSPSVGADKDSDKRQRAAIEAFAKRSGFALVDEFYDAAVSGADDA